MYPNNRQIEIKVLSVLLNSFGEFTNFSDKIKPSYFFSPIHKKIFELLKEYNGKLDADFVLQNFKFQKEIGFEGEDFTEEKIYEIDESYIRSLFSFSYAELNLAIEMLENLHLRRELIEVGKKANAYSKKKSDLLSAYNELHEALLAATENSNSKKTTFVLKEILDDVFLDISKGIESNEIIPTHLQAFNEFMYGGLPKKQLSILGARSGVGKTTTSLKITLSAAINGFSCLIFSQEMTAKSLGIKLLSEMTNIPYMKILTRKLDQQQIDLLNEKRQEFEDLPIVIDESKNLTINYTKNKCLTHKSKFGKLDFVFVDYAQIINIPDDKEKRNVIGNFALGLDSIAQSLDCAVLLLSQLRKPLTKGKKERPSNADLSESDQVLHHASNVFLLYDPFIDLHPDNDRNDIEHLKQTFDGSEYYELMITKNRYGGRLGHVKISKTIYEN
jgi:replicative DNA helicase